MYDVSKHLSNIFARQSLDSFMSYIQINHIFRHCEEMFNISNVLLFRESLEYDRESLKISVWLWLFGKDQKFVLFDVLRIYLQSNQILQSRQARLLLVSKFPLKPFICVHYQSS